jgi:hypothetical protein
MGYEASRRWLLDEAMDGLELRCLGGAYPLEANHLDR